MTRVGAIFSMVAAIAFCQAGPSMAAAPQIGFGASLDDVVSVYKDSAVLATGGRALLIPATEVAGMRFDRVALIFDSGRRLQQIRMTTSAETYERVQAAMAAQLVRAPASADAAFVDVVDQSEDMQIRVCEGDGGQITVTLERTSLSS